MNFNSSFLFMLLLSMYTVGFGAGATETGSRVALTRAEQIPRLPSLDELRKTVAAGAPTDRLRNLPNHDSSSGCEILLQGTAWSIYFKNIMTALHNAGITPQNLTKEEQSFLLSATSLHIAIKLQQGNFKDLEGVADLLVFLGVEEFTFSTEYLAVLNFWLNSLPDFGFYLFNMVRTDGATGELDYSGAHFRKRVFEKDLTKRDALVTSFVREDYRRAIALQTGSDPELLTDDIMGEFMRVRAVLLALRSNYRLERAQTHLKNIRSLQGLMPLLTRD